MARRPKFEISASPSKQQESDLEASYISTGSGTSHGRGRALARTASNEVQDATNTSRSLSTGRPPANDTIHEHVIYEPPTSMTNEGDESEPLISSGQSNANNPKRSSTSSNSNSGARPHRINSLNSYGAIVDAKGIPLQNNGSSGSGIRRQESILKLTGMIDDRAGEFEKFRIPRETLKTLKRPIREFYEAQNELLDGFAECDEILDNTQAEAATGQLAPIIPKKPSQNREDRFASRVKLMINVNLIINIVLLAAKIAVVLLSNSMSLVASTVDSAMDLLSTMIIYGTSRAIEHRSWKTQYEWPTGKRRLEPVGVVCFSVFMIASFLQVFIESVQRVVAKEGEAVSIPLIGGIVMGVTIAIKLVMYGWCKAVKNSSIEALAQDALNDVVFNIFSLIFPFVGQALRWSKLDPIGGMVLSLYIIVEWVGTLLDNTAKLTGRRASPAEHQRVAYLLSRFSPLITGIQHLSLYHAGDHLVVEADVILPHTTALTVAHNLGESAQFAIEQLEGVDRAFVHVDVTVNKLSGHLER